MATAKKTTAKAKKPAAPKKPAAKKAVAAKKPEAAKKPAAPKKAKSVQERYSKTEMLAEIAETTGLTKKQVSAVFDELGGMIERHINKKACGEFVLPGLLKIQSQKIPARKAKKGVPNPFKPGELMDVAAKPASIRVKVRPLKKLKDMAA